MVTYSEWIASFHPMIVHFPIVLLIVGLVCDIVALVAKEYCVGLRLVGHWMIIVGALFTIPAVVSGWFSGELFGWEDPGVVLHRVFGLATLCVVLLNGVLRLFILNGAKQQMIVFTLVLSILSVSLVSWTGETGGILTHGTTPFQMKKIEEIAKIKTERGAFFAENLSPKYIEEGLEKNLTLTDVTPIFEKYQCAHCHNNEFNDSGLKHYIPEWIPRGIDGKPLPLNKVPLYQFVVVENKMPPEEGISDTERLNILIWLKNGAPF